MCPTLPHAAIGWNGLSGFIIGGFETSQKEAVKYYTDGIEEGTKVN
jgi:hypothetical protein